MIEIGIYLVKYFLVSFGPSSLLEKSTKDYTDRSEHQNPFISLSAPEACYYLALFGVIL